MKRLLFSRGTTIRWPMVLAGGLAAAVTVSLYVSRLSSLIGPSAVERLTIETLASLGAIANNPMLLAYKLPASLLMQLSNDPLLAGRLAAVGLAMVSGLLFYMLVRRWHGQLIGAMTSVLFLASSWMLHTGRYAAGYGVFIVTILTLLNAVVWTANSKDRPPGKTLLVYAIISSLALFTPGGLWFALAAAIISRLQLRKLMQAVSTTYRIAAIAIPAAAIALLTTACVRNTEIIRQSLGLPSQFPDIITLGKQAVFSVSGLLVRGPATTEVWLSHTPILDIAASGLLLLGLIFYVRHRNSSRTTLLATFSVLGGLLISLNGAPAMGYVVPIAYLLVGAGLAYLLQQWKRVFPRNPIANAAALMTLTILVSCIVSFHLQRYFIAWRYSPDTTEAYRQAGSDSANQPYLIQ